MMGLSIQLMGPFYVTLHGQPVTSFEYDKVRALLAYLAVEQERPHRREALAGLLWPDLAEEAAESNLRNALSRLRRAINDQHADPPYLLINREDIQFNPASDHWLDVRRFNELLEACQSHTHRRLEACPSCTGRLLEAVNLYRGDFLEGFSLRDSDSFEDWLRFQRDEQREQALKALDTLTLTYERRGEPEKALKYAKRQLKLDPFREEAYRQAMNLYTILGKRAEACELYQQCKLRLVDELDVEPAEETTHLYEQIKYGLLQPSSGQSFRINNLPKNLTSFVGREQELSEIGILIEDPACRLLTLVGPGGVGKTRLAIAAASQQLGSFSYGACFISLQGVASVEGIVPAILQALELNPASGSDLKKTLLDYLSEKVLVLILDNFEHLLEGTDIISELLQNSPGIMVLVTSRQRLGVQAEWLFEVSGLSYPSGKDARELATFEAVELFTQRLHQFKPRQVIFQEDLASVGHICRLVEGLPLGIELAASAARVKTIQQVATAIENGNEDLRSSWKDIPERHRSVQAVFEHSYSMLSGSEQETLCGLAVFRGGFTAQAAKQVAGASLEILESLSQNYLVRFFQDESRYHMHELVRQFAESKLQGQGNKNAYYQKHSHYFLNKLEDWNLQQKGSRLVNALAEMDGDVLNIQASWEWACQQGNISSLVRSWQGLCLYYQYRYRWTEGEHACQSGLKLLDGIKKINPLGKRLKVGLLMYQALFQNLYEEFVQNLEYYGTITNQCLELLETLQQEGEDVRCEKAWVLREKSATITDFEKRLEAAQTSLELTMQIGDRWSISLSLANLAKVHYYAANFEAAERICQDAITECRRLNNLWGLSGALFLMSEITMHLGKLDIAINSAQEYYRVIVSLGKKELYCVGLAAIGMVYITMGKWEKAYKSFSESLPFLSDLGTPVEACSIYANWSLERLFSGHYEEARVMAMSNNELAEKIDAQVHMLNNHYVLGGVALAQGRLDEAFIYLEKSARICEQSMYKFPVARILATQSMTLARMGKSHEAWSLIVEALEYGVKLHSYINLSFALPGAAFLMAISGKYEDTLELWGLIEEKTMCGKSPWLEDVVGKPIKELASSIPLEVIKAAKARGRTMDLFDTAAALLNEFEGKQA